MLSVRDRFTCAYVVPGNLEASSCQHQSHGIGSSTATTALNNLNAVLVNKQASVWKVVGLCLRGHNKVLDFCSILCFRLQVAPVNP